MKIFAQVFGLVVMAFCAFSCGFEVGMDKAAPAMFMAVLFMLNLVIYILVWMKE